jgi:hypothetical protein
MSETHRPGRRTTLLATVFAAVTTMATAGDASASNPDLIGRRGPPASGLPEVAGTPHVGRTVRCDPGTWTSGWRRDGHDIVSVPRCTPRLAPADAGHEVSCRVAVRQSARSARVTP